MKEIRCTTWGSYKEHVDRTILPYHNRFLFRGQGDYKWQLETTFDRKFRNFDKARRDKIEDSLLANFKIECERLEEYSSYLKNEDYLRALAQHFALPTRLLDWTQSPYIAAFFAFQEHFESSDFFYRDSKEVAVYILDKNANIWSASNGVQIKTIESIKNARLRNQAGVFTLSNTPFKTLDEFVAYGEDKDALSKVSLPIAEAKTAIKDLQLMGIKHSTLFPDLEGISKAAMFKTFMEFESP